MNKKSGTVALAIMFLCFSSCVRRPLSSMSTGLMLEFVNDYTLAFEQTASVPEHFRVNMYDAVSGLLVYNDFAPSGGGIVRSLPGNYLCFACNFDEGGLILSGEERILDFHITAPPADGRYDFMYMECIAKAAEMAATKGDGATESTMTAKKTNVLKLQDYFWAGKAEVTVPALAESDAEYVLSLETHSALNQGSITLNGLKGTEYISSINCFFTDLSAGMNPITGDLDKQSVTHTFQLQISDGKAHGTFLYFGMTPEQQEKSHLLYVLITDTGGGRYLKVYTLKNIERDKEICFTIETDISIDEPEYEGGGGFLPNLEEWNVEYVDIPLGQ